MKQRQTGERVLISFDYAIKRLLRDKANYEVLEGFLSELLLKNVSVKSIGESESNQESPEDKHNRVDILVEDESGEILLIELQFTQQIDFMQRMLYGVSKAITERMVRGDDYIKVRKIYSINIVYFDLGQGDDYVYHGKTHFMGLHKNDELRLSDAQRETFKKETATDIYPEYYLLKVNSFNDVAKDTLDEWIYFFKHNVIKDEFKAKGMDRAREALERDNLTPEERRAYDEVMRQRSEDLSFIASSKLISRIEGRKEGEIIGLEKGLEKGREEGREEGRIEREKLADELAKERKEREEREKEYANLRAEITRLKQNG
ncbi:MAG: Rpn family recombination-promoting nuclease/putative transposase [Bacteroidales bacterium]|nr:Rpn family recombination-promoting nuclease/putative transposase [Bacteroidales bacterium]